MELFMETEQFWTPQAIQAARARWSTFQTRTNLAFGVLCTVLTVLAFAISRLQPEPIPLWAMSLIWATWWFASAMLEVLVHTGLHVQIPGAKDRICLVPKIFPNSDHLSVLVEGHEKTWPHERDIILNWWKRGWGGSGWEAAPDSRWFSGVLVGSVYLTAMVAMYSNSSPGAASREALL